jgi:drug/metabolite transporter (DMT)-like permease
MSERRHHLDAFAVGLMIFLCAIWGINQVAAKVANQSISPVLQAGLRSAGAALLLWGWAWLRGIPLFERDGTLKAGIGVGLLFAAEFAFIFWGLNYTSASRGVVFLYTAPFVVALGIPFFVPSEKLTRWQGTGMVLAFLGVIAAFAENLAMPTGTQMLGDAMLLMGAIFWGSTTIMVRASSLSNKSASKTLFYQLAVSALALPLASLALGEPGFTNPTALGLGLLAWQTIIVAFASYLAWFWLIANYPATKLSSFSFLTPLFGTMAGALLLDEPLTPQLLAAMVLVALGIWLVNRRPKTA